MKSLFCVCVIINNIGISHRGNATKQDSKEQEWVCSRGSPFLSRGPWFLAFLLEPSVVRRKVVGWGAGAERWGPGS